MSALAFVVTVLSALALYAGSAHCRWRGLQRWRGTGTWAGLALAVVALLAWVAELGVGAGLCVMLGTWMLALMALPCLALLHASDADGRGEP
jgi:hypothetical protein